MSGCSADALRPRSSLPPAPAVVDFFADPFTAWPLLLPGMQAQGFSSFDREGGNADGFRGLYGTLSRNAQGESVIVHAVGPGVLRTLWFTGEEEGGELLDLGVLRFYLDGEEAPRFVAKAEAFFAGRAPPFVKPLVADNHISSGAYVSWKAIPFAKALVVTTSRPPRFFAAQVDTFSPDTRVESFDPYYPSKSGEALFRRALQGRWGDTTFRTVPLRYEHSGAGTIEGLRFTPRGSRSTEALNRARVQISFDGAAKPQVDVPLGFFFGSALGEVDIRAVAFSLAPGGSYENRFPMPFWQGFSLTIKGMDGVVELAVGKARDPKHAGIFHARYAYVKEPSYGVDVELLSFKGAGKLVGTVLGVTPRAPEDTRWWEGDLRSYADGMQTPRLHGTGVEDDHLGGWSNTFFCNPFSLPMHGAPASHLVGQYGPQLNAHLSAYRLYPGLPFFRSISHGMEHGSENLIDVEYRAVAFFYAHDGVSLVSADALDLFDGRERDAHGYEVEGAQSLEEVESAFEGRGYATLVTGKVFPHRGRARFLLRPSQANHGCFLRRRFDQKQGGQRAAVVVDGRAVTEWYAPGGNGVLRWAEDQVFLPARVTRGKERIQVDILPRKESPLWAPARYELLCVQQGKDTGLANTGR
ncbi:MAG: DUF2961 domain-containing protein [Deltaproteobacteria bacterium]|nr:DUF2961 domain-containing protein [Deltaproteobacteria bacterium]